MRQHRVLKWEKHNGSIKARRPAKIRGNWRMHKRQSLNATGHIGEGKRFHMVPILLSLFSMPPFVISQWNAVFHQRSGQRSLEWFLCFDV